MQLGSRRKLDLVYPVSKCQLRLENSTCFPLAQRYLLLQGAVCSPGAVLIVASYFIRHCQFLLEFSCSAILASCHLILHFVSCLHIFIKHQILLVALSVIPVFSEI